MAVILVVDDEGSIRATVRAFLENDGHTVAVAASAEEALRLTADLLPDVVVVDVILPGKDGLELLRILRRAHPSLQGILITGAPHPQGASDALAVGAFDYLVKPIAREQISRSVAAACRSVPLTATIGRLAGQSSKAVSELDAKAQEEVERLRTAWRESEAYQRHRLIIERLAQSLGSTSDRPLLHRVIAGHVRQVMDTAMFIVSSYEQDAQLIRALYVLNDGREMDPESLPAIPLAEEGRGRQSQVIRTGEPLMVHSKARTQHMSDTEYAVSSDGAVRPGVDVDQDDVIRSAIFVPMKRRGRVCGVIQVQSYRADAYSEQDLDLLLSMANLAVIALGEP